ncbi:MAG: TM0106 family RecB-like putative nuclease [Verrucomicrobia bacterium]|nr:TM0106 family RecB-like putative nuclease [Verrucomicrobiota bacterium]
MRRINNSEPLIFSASHFFKYATQPLWIWYDRFGEQSKKEEISEFTLKLMESGVLHEDEYIAGLEVSKVEAVKAEEAIDATIALMRQGAGLIYQGCIQIEREGVIYRGRPDLLERREGSSIFGNWYYAPIEIKWSSKAKTVYKHQLTLYAIILEKLQEYFPKEVWIINRHHDRLTLTLDEDDISKTQSLIEQIVNVMNGEKPDVTITSKSKNSPWFKVALEEAKEKQDIALIYRLDSRSLGALRKEGIRTLQEMVAANLSALPKIPYASPETLRKAQLQAKSLLEKQIIQIGEMDGLPETSLKLYFDIEGDPLIDVDYLFGIWVSGDAKQLYAKAQNMRFCEDGKYFVYFLAKQPEEEEAMWQAFLKWTACLPEEYTVYHYANYEKDHLELLADEYGGVPALERFQSKIVDLQKVVEKGFIFPLYFYSIKDIAKSSFLNFKWRHHKAGGGQSVFWYEQWLETGNIEILEDIINYNEDDVRATECLYLWCRQNANI